MSAQAPQPDMASQPEALQIDFPDVVAREFPSEFPSAWAAVDQVLAAIDGVDLAPLARRSPSLMGYDWPTYLRCSVARVVRVIRALATYAPPGGRVLDYGSYFGNFTLPAVAAGFVVDSIDAYATYGDALARLVEVQGQAGARVLDFADEGHDLQAIPVATYDAVICAGVIEHVPHTPRRLLETISRVLKPDGLLLLDTPNLAYLYKRLALGQGQTIFAPIAQQYHTEIPFEGHHREYTPDEIKWMLREAGHALLALDMFNYSVLAQRVIVGEHVIHHRRMQEQADLRELIFAVSRSGAAARGD